MTDCLKGKAHEWRLRGSDNIPPMVTCCQCGEFGTLRDLDNDAGQFYAMRDERDKLQAELKARDEQTCETCVSFHAGTYDCRTESIPLSCVAKDYDGWEAKP